MKKPLKKVAIREPKAHKKHYFLEDVYSVSINLSYRITIEFWIEDKKIIPIHVGTHDDVYR